MHSCLIVSQLVNGRYVLFHMMRDVNADRQQTTMANWCIIVVVAVIMVYESSVVVNKNLYLAPCLAMKLHHTLTHICF